MPSLATQNYSYGFTYHHGRYLLTQSLTHSLIQHILLGTFYVLGTVPGYAYPAIESQAWPLLSRSFQFSGEEGLQISHHTNRHTGHKLKEGLLGKECRAVM